MNTFRILLLMCCFYLSTSLHLHAQTVDLEVTMSTANPNPNAYNHVPVTYTLHNKGTATATNIRVQIGACNPTDNTNELFYGDRVQLVYSSSAQPTTSLGTYERTNQGWEVPQLAPNSKATLTVTFFTLTEEERTLLAFVTRVDQTDQDSSPTYLQNCTTVEDDEAALILNDTGGPRPCEYFNQPWLTDRLSNSQGLCTTCLSAVNVYNLSGEIYIEFKASNTVCNDGLTTIYTCTGEEFCREGGVAGFRECEVFFNNNPILVETLWNRQTDCSVEGNSGISGKAWRDGNGDGIQTTLVDYTLENIKVNLENQNGSVIASTMTRRGNGSYNFTRLLPGSYRVAFEIPSNFSATLKQVGIGTAVDSDINPNGKTDLISLGTQDLAQGIDAGLRPEPFASFGTIPARVWRDNNGDGIRGFGDEGISGEFVQLLDLNGNIVAAGQSDENGEVSLEGIPAGSYRVQFIEMFGTTATIKNASGSFPNNDSDINPDLLTDIITLAPGQVLTEIGGGFRFEQGGDIDLGVGMSIDNSDIDIYNRFKVLYRVSNGGNTPATNVKVQLGVCDSSGDGFSGRFGFVNTNGIVNSSPAADASMGAYSVTSQTWSIPVLNPGETAFLELYLFTLTEEERILIAQVSNVNENDSDSTPNNMSGCSSSEDDERTITINGDGNGELPDFILTNVGYFASTPGENFTEVNTGRVLPAGTLVGSLFHGVGGNVPDANRIYETKTKIFLSTDAIPDAGDIVLKTLDNNIRSVGGGSVFQEGGLGAFTIPEDTPAGTYNIITQLDANNDFEESNEENNILIVTGVIITTDNEAKPDFELNNLFVQAFESSFIDRIRVGNGSTITLREGVADLSYLYSTVIYQVPNAPQSFDVKLKTYLSTDNQLDASDREIFTYDYRLNATINQNAEDKTINETAILNNVTAGEYFLITKFDADNQVAETNENNNTITYAVTIQEETSSCPCPAVVDPVCGSDGVTYNNSCEAECAGITDYTSGTCPIGTDGVDLELEIIAPATYAIYTKVLFQARIENTGTVNAEGVKVDFKIPAGFVHSSNSASVGTYDLYREEWNVGTLKAGTSAVLELTLFALGTDEVIAYAQVSACQQNDVDSTPANGSCCVADEDDEAVATVVSSFKNTGNTGALRSTNIHTDLQIKSLYPTIATDEINLFVQSKLSELHLTIYNLQGEPVLEKYYSETTGFQRLQIDVDNLPTGMYLVRFEGTVGKETVRFIKMQM